MEQSENEPIVVGWRERVDLPEWGIYAIRAKLDTGAKTSAIHVSDVEDVGEGRIRFTVVTRERPSRRSVRVEADIVRESRVRPSTGERQRRPVVMTTMRLGPVERAIEIGLVCREGMLCRMLLGRSALGALAVDPSRKYIVTPRIPARSDTGPRRRTT